MRYKRMLAPARFNPHVFARRIRALTDERGTLREVARKANVEAGVLSRIGTNDTIEPRLPTLWNLADYFGVSLDYLVGRGDHQEDDIPSRQLWILWNVLTTEERTELLRLAKKVGGKGERGKAAS